MLLIGQKYVFNIITKKKHIKLNTDSIEQNRNLKAYKKNIKRAKCQTSFRTK